jgi:hypothetical protein
VLAGIEVDYLMLAVNANAVNVALARLVHDFSV